MSREVDLFELSARKRSSSCRAERVKFGLRVSGLADVVSMRGFRSFGYGTMERKQRSRATVDESKYQAFIEMRSGFKKGWC